MNVHVWEVSDELNESLERKYLPMTEKPTDVLSIKWKMDEGVKKVELQGEKYSEKLQFTGKLMEIER